MKERLISGVSTFIVLVLILVFRPGQQLRQFLSGLLQPTTTEQLK